MRNQPEDVLNMFLNFVSEILHYSDSLLHVFDIYILNQLQPNMILRSMKSQGHPGNCYIMVIELRVVQFWSEIILVISNRTRAARSFDFEITRMISDQIALHLVQLPLYNKVNSEKLNKWRMGYFLTFNENADELGHWEFCLTS